MNMKRSKKKIIIIIIKYLLNKCKIVSNLNKQQNIDSGPMFFLLLIYIYIYIYIYMYIYELMIKLIKFNLFSFS
jgi:hypothetical protein